KEGRWSGLLLLFVPAQSLGLARSAGAGRRRRDMPAEREPPDTDERDQRQRASGPDHRVAPVERAARIRGDGGGRRPGNGLRSIPKDDAALILAGGGVTPVTDRFEPAALHLASLAGSTVSKGEGSL